MKTKKFCSLTPTFPQNMFIVLLFIKSGKNTLAYPLFETFSDYQKINKTTKKLKRQLEKRNEDTTVYAGLVATLEYHHSFPLKKEYWDVSETKNLNKDIRMMAFLKLFNDPHQFFWVAITPQSFNNKTQKWRLTNWLPIKITSTDEQIEALIKTSDQSVDEQAKSIGLYSVVNIQGLNIDTGQLFQPKTSVITKEPDC
ncbi:hypothetical protein KBC75_02445 [Candidatus Shapirobacteria bacterium]|nr:hypothetical protein [Candidatus Shapirobacteria bacterium]